MGKHVALQLQGFIVAGGFATLFHWVVMASLIAAGIEPLVATAGGSVSGATLNYALQRSLAFPNAGSHLLVLWRYVGACAIAWLCNSAFFFFFYSLLELSVLSSQFISTGLVAGLNYIIYKRVVFYEKAY